MSFAVGALLGAVFLELLPHALEAGSTERVMATVLAGLLAFFLLEKLVLWRHSHGHDAHRDDAEETEHEHALHMRAGHDHGRTGLMILIGTAVHNFCDGVVIAASFLADIRLGLATTVAIVAHAVPQQVGDFAVLLHSGFTRQRAFVYNVSAGLATLDWRARELLRARADAAGVADGARDRRGQSALRRGCRPHPEPAPPARAARNRETGAIDRTRRCGHLRGAHCTRALTAQYCQ